MDNPFRPTPGATPREIIGRERLLDEFAYGLRLRSGAPGMLTIFTGARGVGKTVMLGAAEDLACAQGWVVVSETATKEFMGRIGSTMRQVDEELGRGPQGRRVTAVIGPRMGAKPNTVGNDRTRMIGADLIEPAGYGLVRFAIPGLREHVRQSHR